ncbi:hypothetical protein ULG90_08090 [Halopseudomonas pachastrellae]|nr:hypothetical protein ULG90_08090 [Halopseudomonas pachastrellae]
MGEVEDLLQQFLEDRQNGSLLQQSIEGLQQLRGTLALIELKGAAQLLDEMIELATDIPVHEGEQRNERWLRCVMRCFCCSGIWTRRARLAVSARSCCCR